MSELQAEIKLSFSSKKKTEAMFLELSALKDILSSGKGKNTLPQLINWESLDLSNVSVSSLLLDKSSIYLSLEGGISQTAEILDALFNYCLENNIKKFIAYSLNDQVFEYDYLCIKNGTRVPYTEGMNSIVDKKLDKAKKKGDLLKVIERLVSKDELHNLVQELDSIIEEYVETSEFKGHYIEINELKTERNFEGDTLLTAMIKSKNDKESFWLIENAMELDPYISDSKGNTPLELAQANNLEMTVEALQDLIEDALDLDVVEADELGFPNRDTDFSQMLINIAQSKKLYLYGQPYSTSYTLANSKVIVPGENQLNIYREYYNEDKILYQVGYYCKSKPNEYFVREGLDKKELLRVIDQFSQSVNP